MFIRKFFRPGLRQMESSEFKANLILLPSSYKLVRQKKILPQHKSKTSLKM